ncbi:hypothetical protein Tco_1103435 [Tanacetum coccineum]
MIGRPILVLPPTEKKVIYCEQTAAGKYFYDALFKKSKESMDSTMDKVIRLMIEVEREKKVAEEAIKSGLDIFEKMDERIQAHGQALLALQNILPTLFYSANTSFDALLVSLLSTTKLSHQSAGIVKQALFSIAQCVVVLCLAAEDYNCSFVGEEDRLEWQNRLRKLQNIMLGGSSHPPST